MNRGRRVILLVWMLLGVLTTSAQHPDIRSSLETAFTNGDSLRLPSQALESPVFSRAFLRLHSDGIPGTAELNRYFEELEAMAARHPDWPWPQLLEAAMLRRLAQSREQVLPFPGIPEGLGWSEVFFQKLQDAISSDPDYTFARRYALDALELVGDRYLGDPERALLARELDRENPVPIAVLLAGRQQRLLGRFDSALTLLSVVKADAVDPGILRLEKARTLRGLGRRELAAVEWIDGLRNPSVLARNAYRHDLAFVVHPDSLGGFDQTPDDSLQTWATAFWAMRDAEAANAPGERLVEHLNRWAIAHLVFRLHSPWRRTQYESVETQFLRGATDCVGYEPDFFRQLWQLQPSRPGDVRSNELILDHRGLILLRHGRPYARVVGSKPGGPVGSIQSRIIRLGLELGDDHEESERHFTNTRSETWLLRLHGSWRFLHFRPSAALGDYAATTLGTFLPAFHWDYETLSALSPMYVEAARRLSSSHTPVDTNVDGRFVPAHASGNCIKEVREIISKARVDARELSSQDADEPRMDRVWQGAGRLYAVNHGNRSALTLVAAIPVADLRGTSVRVPLRLSRFGKEAGRSLLVLDTIMDLDQVRGQYAYGVFTLDVDRDLYTVGALLGQEGEGGFHLSDQLRTTRRSGIRVSQLLLGHEIVPIGIEFAGERFPLSPFEYWAQNTPMLVGYEISGAGPDSEVEVVTEVVRNDQRGTAIRVSRREQVGPDGAIQRAIRVGLRNLREGKYTVRVVVKQGGQTSSSERDVRVAQ